MTEPVIKDETERLRLRVYELETALREAREEEEFQRTEKEKYFEERHELRRERDEAREAEGIAVQQSRKIIRSIVFFCDDQCGDAGMCGTAPECSLGEWNPDKDED